jgi:flagellar assembly protein FliH
MTQILDPFRQALGTADRMLEEMLARYETQLVELVCQIAGKVVMAKLDADDTLIKNTILDALSQLAFPEQINLSVAEEDYEYVEMIKETFFESVRSLTNITVNTDAMIPKGGCRIESAGATITTDPESKLKAVYDAIAQAGK